MKTHLKSNKTPQDDQYEDAPKEQPIAQHNTTKHEHNKILLQIKHGLLL